MSNNGSGSNNTDWQDAETGWYQGANSTPRRFDPMTGKPLNQPSSQPSPSQTNQPQKQRGPGVGAIAGITVVVLAALVGFGIVWFFNGSKDNAPVAAQQSVNRAPTQSAESDSSATSSPTSGSSSSSPTSTADFPESSTTQCSIDGTESTESISDSNVRADGGMTCGFVDNIAHDAQQHLREDPSAKNFDMQVWSDYKHRNYDVSCHNDSGLTSCYTTSKAPKGGLLGVFIRD